MKLRNTKHFIAGIIAGITIMAAVPVLAENERVVALIDRTIKLEIAGEVKTLPEGYEVLTYKGFTYLPSRYVAEQLGCKVRWNEDTRWITISEPAEKVVEKIVEVPVEVIKEVYVERDTAYQNLPASATADRISITAKSISRIVGFSNTNTTRVSFELTNNADGPIAIDYADAVLTVDGKNYKVGESSSQMWDDWLIRNDIQQGQSYSGYFSFPIIEEGTKNFILTVPTRLQGEGKRSAVTIRFNATLNKE